MQVSSPSSPQKAVHSQWSNQSPSSPLRGRVWDWKKAFFASTLIVLVSQVAVAFFLDIPLLSIGISALGVLYSLLYFRTVKQENALPTLSDYDKTKSKVSELSEKYTRLEAKSQADLQGLKNHHKQQLEQESKRLEEQMKFTEQQRDFFKVAAESGQSGPAMIKLQQEITELKQSNSQKENQLKELQTKWTLACKDPLKVLDIKLALQRTDFEYTKKLEGLTALNNQYNQAHARLEVVKEEIRTQERNLNEITNQVNKGVKAVQKSQKN